MQLCECQGFHGLPTSTVSEKDANSRTEDGVVWISWRSWRREADVCIVEAASFCLDLVLACSWATCMKIRDWD